MKYIRNHVQLVLMPSLVEAGIRAGVSKLVDKSNQKMIGMFCTMHQSDRQIICFESFANEKRTLCYALSSIHQSKDIV